MRGGASVDPFDVARFVVPVSQRVCRHFVASAPVIGAAVPVGAVFEALAVAAIDDAGQGVVGEKLGGRRFLGVLIGLDLFAKELVVCGSFCGQLAGEGGNLEQGEFLVGVGVSGEEGQAAGFSPAVEQVFVGGADAGAGDGGNGGGGLAGVGFIGGVDDAAQGEDDAELEVGVVVGHGRGFVGAPGVGLSAARKDVEGADDGMAFAFGEGIVPEAVGGHDEVFALFGGDLVEQFVAGHGCGKGGRGLFGELEGAEFEPAIKTGAFGAIA